MKYKLYMETEKKSGSKLIPILVFAAIIIAVGLYGFFFLNQKDNIIQGEADVTEVRISSKVPGRISRYLVEEGSFVKKGDTLESIARKFNVSAKLISTWNNLKGKFALKPGRRIIVALFTEKNGEMVPANSKG